MWLKIGAKALFSSDVIAKKGHTCDRLLSGDGPLAMSAVFLIAVILVKRGRRLEGISEMSLLSLLD
jgi:hypothetical protein